MRITPEEIRQKKLNAQNLKQAVRAVREAGFVVLESVLSKDWCEKMRQAWDGMLYEDKRGDRLKMPFMDPLAIENPWGVQIMEEVMGKDLWGTLPYWTNAARPGEGIQEVHRDTRQLFPDVHFPLPTHNLIIHIPLVDFTEENGSTEVWPGTHLIADMDIGDSRNPQMEARSKTMPSIRANMPAGSVMVRDMRVWHRRMPNKTNRVRTMLSLVYWRYMLAYPQLKFNTLPKETGELMSERARQLYRFNPIEGEDKS